jgi:hypothetical protein
MNRASVVLVWTVVACGEPGGRVRIIDRVEQGGALSFRDVKLKTLDDVSEVRGDIGQLWGHASVRLSLATIARDRGAARADYISNPTAVHARWITDGDVVVPTDFDSLVMLTAYAHFEAAALHFANVGASSASDRIPIYYLPEIDKEDDFNFPESDNAAYFPEADGFLLLPMDVFQEIPFAMNPGVVGHEFSHRVFYYEMWGGEMFASLEEYRMLPGSRVAWNRVRATDEGVADFFGAAITGDAAFLAHSVPEAVSAPRDLNEVRSLKEDWVAGIQPEDDHGNYAVYLPGAVIASALWRASHIAGIEPTELALLAALRDLRSQVRDDFQYEFGDLEAAMLGHLPEDDRAAVCIELQQSYAVVWSAFAGTCY